MPRFSSSTSGNWWLQNGVCIHTSHRQTFNGDRSLEHRTRPSRHISNVRSARMLCAKGLLAGTANIYSLRLCYKGHSGWTSTVVAPPHLTYSINMRASLSTAFALFSVFLRFAFVDGQTKIVLTNDDGWAVANIRAQNSALIAAGFNVSKPLG